MASTSAEVIAARLLADGPTTALVSTRITPSKPVQEPDGDYLCFWRQSGGDGVTLDGPTASHWEEIRVEATAATQARAEAILKAVRESLHGWRDVANGVQGSFAQGDADEQTLEDGRQVSGQSFMIRFKPT